MKNVTHTFAYYFLLTASSFLTTAAFSGLRAQTSTYDNFEGSKFVTYYEKGGVLDSTAKNPAADQVNGSDKCGMYVRNGSKKFDNIKMALSGGLGGVEKYATYEGMPPRFKMKIYTTAPAGTLVEILLGTRKGNNDYPSGTHSQYQAYTKVSNQWEELEFLFSQIPQGSQTSPSQIDQIVLLFNPNSATSDTYYFDDITGPVVTAAVTATASNAGETKASGSGAVNNSAGEVAPATDKPEQGTKPRKNKKSKR